MSHAGSQPLPRYSNTRKGQPWGKKWILSAVPQPTSRGSEQTRTHLPQVATQATLLHRLAQPALTSFTSYM